jgi:dihydroorotate dehydrogenase (NAD+) catalytic subunit
MPSTAGLAVRIGGVTLKNPLICGSGEHVMSAAGIESALAAGAGAVIVKSTNESEAAKRQLDRTDYALLDAAWRRLPWNFAPPRDASLFCRSGLAQQDFPDWLAMVARLDRAARASDSYVVASLILADLERSAGLSQEVEAAGIRILELNIGAPHGGEAAPGAIVLEREASRVRTIVARIRKSVRLTLWVKLTGQSEDVAALALAAKEAGADAVTIMGRFMAFLPDLETMAPLLGTSAAIGGGWALPLTCRWLALSRRRLGADYPLIATNGARNGLDIARFLLAGASAVQMTSAILSEGFAVIPRCLGELTDYLASRERSAASLVGLAADRLGAYHEQIERPGYWKEFVPPGGLGEDL